MQTKRGQTTLFIILAIIIIAAIFLVLYLTGTFSTTIPESDIGKIKSYLDSCFELKTKEGLVFIAKQGGYNQIPEISIDFLGENGVYYYKNEQNLIPSVNIVERELDSWLSEHLSECLTYKGYSLDFTDCNTDTEIINNTIKTEFDCPITIKRGFAKDQLRLFSTQFQAPVINILETSDEIVNNYKENPGYLCVDCLNDIGVENNVNITAVPVIDIKAYPNFIWMIIDSGQEITDKNLKWRFIIET